MKKNGQSERGATMALFEHARAVHEVEKPLGREQAKLLKEEIHTKETRHNLARSSKRRVTQKKIRGKYRQTGAGKFSEKHAGVVAGLGQKSSQPDDSEVPPWGPKGRSRVKMVRFERSRKTKANTRRKPRRGSMKKMLTATENLRRKGKPLGGPVHQKWIRA